MLTEFALRNLAPRTAPYKIVDALPRVKERGAPATAVPLRDIVKQIYAYANLLGEKVENPADEIGVASIATFVPKDRVLSPLGCDDADPPHAGGVYGGRSRVQEGRRGLIFSKDSDSRRCRSLAATASTSLNFQRYSLFQRLLK